MTNVGIICPELAGHLNPTTAIALTPQPSNSRAQSATLPELTQTVANPYRRASSQSLTRSSWVAPGFSSV